MKIQQTVRFSGTFVIYIWILFGVISTIYMQRICIVIDWSVDSCLHTCDCADRNRSDTPFHWILNGWPSAKATKYQSKYTVRLHLTRIQHTHHHRRHHQHFTFSKYIQIIGSHTILYWHCWLQSPDYQAFEIISFIFHSHSPFHFHIRLIIRINFNNLNFNLNAILTGKPNQTNIRQTFEKTDGCVFQLKILF